MLIAVFALIGTVVSVFASMLLEPIGVSISSPVLPGGNASLEVYFSEHARYIWTGPDTPAFRLQAAFWTWGLPIFIILGGAVGGGLVGYLIDRFLQRAPWRINA